MNSNFLNRHVSVSALVFLALLFCACAHKSPSPAADASSPQKKSPQTLEARIKAWLEGSTPSLSPVSSLENQKKIFVNQDVHFAYDQFMLNDESIAILKEKIKFLQNHSQLQVIIEGHCDERGTTEYNLALGARRAQAVKEYLKAHGIAKERLTSISYGKEVPLDPGHTEDAWAINRRAHFVIVYKSSS